jgi:hypothetical protein
MSLDNRETALLYWAALGLVVLLYRRETRSSLIGVLKALVAPKLFIMLLSLTAWVGLLAFLLSRVGLWRSSLLPETVLWFVGPGLVATFRLTEGKDPTFFRRALNALFGLTILLEFVMNLRPAPLLVELFLVPILLVTVGVHAIAANDPRQRGTRTAMDFLLALVGLTLLGYTIIGLAQSPKHFATLENLRELLLPLLLAIGYLPLAYLVALLTAYETLFIRLDWKLGPGPTRKHAKWRAIRSAHINLRTVHHFSKTYAFMLSDSMGSEAVARAAKRVKDEVRPRPSRG